MSKRKKVACLITTDKDKRGVFMGYVDPDCIDQEVIEAEDVRICVYWSRDVRGVLGLAANGPSESSRISKAAPKAKLHGVTAVFEITKEAEANWKKEPWG